MRAVRVAEYGGPEVLLPVGDAGPGGGGRRGRRPAKLDLVTRLGADAVVDHSEVDWTARVREAARGIERVQFEAPQTRRLAARALAEAAAGRLRPVIGREFALSDAAEAHRAVEGRSVNGKALLRT